ncbi:hypothetical protein D3C75_1076940 [compost metagenome]
MLRGFRVEGDVGGTRFDKVANDAVNRADHQVHVDRRSNAVLAQSGTDHRTDGQVGDIVIVHDIEVDDVGTRSQYLVDVLAQSGEIGGENGGGNSVGLHGAPVGRITVARIVTQGSG